MDQWQILLESFLRNECSDREKKIVYYALRDGLIDEEFRSAVDNFIYNQEMALSIIDDSGQIPEHLLENICSRLKKQEKKICDETK